jgi:hypothetical protein
MVNGSPQQIQLPLLNCGRCGDPAREEQGLAARGAQPPLRFRCTNAGCLSGPYCEDPVQAVHGWNRVTQGWLGMDVLQAIGRQIPQLEPQIADAMQKRWEALLAEVAEKKNPPPKPGGPRILRP